MDKKSKSEFIKVRATKSTDKPLLIVNMPRTIVNQFNIEIGDTFESIVKSDNKIMMIKGTIY
jgi:hypothetical protein